MIVAVFLFSSFRVLCTLIITLSSIRPNGLLRSPSDFGIVYPLIFSPGKPSKTFIWVLWNDSSGWHGVTNSVCIYDNIQSLARWRILWLLSHSVCDREGYNQLFWAAVLRCFSSNSPCFTAIREGGSGDIFVNFHSRGSLNLWWFENCFVDCKNFLII